MRSEFVRSRSIPAQNALPGTLFTKSRLWRIPHLADFAGCGTTQFFLILLLLLTSCSPRDFLTRRLAADLIAASTAFKTPQQFELHTGIVDNKEYLSPESLVLQHKGWITATSKPCPRNLAPPPCWDVILTPSGVETIRVLIPPEDLGKQSFNLRAARRELLEITGISKQGNLGDVDFTWRWTPLNEFGAAFYSQDVR